MTRLSTVSIFALLALSSTALATDQFSVDEPNVKAKGTLTQPADGPKLAPTTDPVPDVSAAPAAAPAKPSPKETVLPPAPAPVAPIPAAPVVVQNQPCTELSVSAKEIDSSDKPATYTLTVKDSAQGFVDALKACNKPKTQIGQMIPSSTATATIKVTQMTDQTASFKVPSDRAAGLMIELYIKKADWVGKRFFTSGGPINSQTDIVLNVSDKDPGNVY